MIPPPLLEHCKTIIPADDRLGMTVSLVEAFDDLALENGPTPDCLLHIASLCLIFIEAQAGDAESKLKAHFLNMEQQCTLNGVLKGFDTKAFNRITSGLMP